MVVVNLQPVASTTASRLTNDHVDSGTFRGRGVRFVGRTCEESGCDGAERNRSADGVSESWDCKTLLRVPVIGC
jgi:hypothetical protein